MKRATTIVATLATTVAATLAAHAAPAEAAVESASVVGSTATLNLDGADDNVTVSVAGGLLVHGQTTGGLSSGRDWDSQLQGDQTVPADGTFSLVVNGGDGNDTITVLAKSSEIVNVTLNGGAGDDVLTGADSGDSLNGGDGNDRLVGAKGGDDMNGGAGDDTFVWNNGDGSDFIEGDAGTDTTEVNGDPTLGDVFTLEPDAGAIKFRRTNLTSFTLIASTERFQVNSLGGDDSVGTASGVGALMHLSVDGGAGNDRIGGSDEPDLFRGGGGSDHLLGGGGDDTFVWNNGDGSDVVDGGDGSDDIEVNGDPAAADIFNVLQGDGGAIRVERSNLAPFAIDTTSSETVHVNGLGGDDAITVVGKVSVTATGGPGDDTLTGGDASETFLGGPGNDTIDPGGGPDFVSGDDGDDTINVRDNTSDVASGGAGNDSVIADAGLDVLDGFETVNGVSVLPPPPVVTPPPPVVPPPAPVVTPPPAVTPAPIATRARPVTITGGTVKVKKGSASIRLSCPTTSPANCTGSLTLRTEKPVKLARRKVIVKLGTVRYNLRPGTSRTLKVKLAQRSRGLADGNARLRVLAIASTGPAGHIAQSSRRLTLALGTTTRR